jgi:hypothetical protein
MVLNRDRYKQNIGDTIGATRIAARHMEGSSIIVL